MLPEWHRELTADFTVGVQPALSPQREDDPARTRAVGGRPDTSCPILSHARFSADACSES